MAAGNNSALVCASGFEPSADAAPDIVRARSASRASLGSVESGTISCRLRLFKCGAGELARWRTLGKSWHWATGVLAVPREVSRFVLTYGLRAKATPHDSALYVHARSQ